MLRIRPFLALSGLLLLGAAAAPPLDGRALALRAEAMALVARDGEADLSRAQGLLDEAARLEPRLYQARADRTLERFLAAAALRDEASRLDDGAPLMRDGREMREAALEDLRPLVRTHPADPAVVRALALYYGLDGDAGQVARLSGQARAAGATDAWVDFAELAASARAADPGESIPLLSAFAASHPEMMRPRMMLARALFDSGRRDEALAEIDALLAANPEHDRAKRLRSAILSPPPARMAVFPTPDDAPPPQPRGLLPRKPSRSQVPARPPGR